MSKGRVVWIPADPEEGLLTVETSDEPMFEQMQEYCGGFIEHVFIAPPDGEKMAHMFVNEEGLIHGLPLNPRATEHYQRAIKEQGVHIGLYAPVIVGPAVLLLDIPLQGYDY